MVGTLMGGSLAAAESFALCGAVLDALAEAEPGVAAPLGELPTPELETFATSTAGVVDDEAMTPSVVIWVSWPEGRASLLAAQPKVVTAAKAAALRIEYLTNNVEGIR
jgi:hypothetical protein